jgi:hypothetical protein
LALLASLFLVWSHQLSAPALRSFRRAGALDGVVLNPTAWQLYTSMDVVLAAVAVGVVAAGALGGWRVRALAALLACAALAFVVHALAVPPTNGVLVIGPGAAGAAARYAVTGATAGVGETVAIAGLGVALAGLLISLRRG